MWQRFIESVFLKRFGEINLTGLETVAVQNAVQHKYVPALREGVASTILMVPAAFLFDSQILATVLIPITMVAGTAWFAISLATVRMKFQKFGVELTAEVFKSFVGSLGVLGLLTIVSFSGGTAATFADWVQDLGGGGVVVKVIAGAAGLGVVFRILWNLFSGSLKYDLNDAMLIGQNEASERYFRRALLLLTQTSENLRAGKDLEVANYNLGWSFYDIFNFVKSVSSDSPSIEKALARAMELRNNPSIRQENADKISVELIRFFLELVGEAHSETAQQTLQNIKNEVEVIEKGGESQKLVDSRFAVIFSIIGDLLAAEGDQLFATKSGKAQK